MSSHIVSTCSSVSCLPWIASKAFFYSKTPILVSGKLGCICGINAALRVLMGRDVAGSKGQGMDFLSSRLGPALDGELFPAGGVARSRKASQEAEHVRPMYDEIGVVTGRCRYRSSDFGLADLSTVEVPCIDPSSGELVGSVLNVEMLSLEKETDYCTALERRWAHEVMWEIYAYSYDRIIPELPFYKEVLGRHLETLQRIGVGRVLDVGAGTGLVTIPLLKRGVSVTAVDVSRAMLERLYCKLDTSTGSIIDVIEDTAESLPQLADASFDGVNALNSFFDMDDPHAALREAIRVLRPGGYLVITEPRECCDAEALKAIAESHLVESGIYNERREDWIRVRSVTPALGERIASKRTPAGHPSTKPPWHAEVIHETLLDLGFVKLSFEHAYEGHCATIRGNKPS